MRDAERIARKLSTLVDLGLERVPPPPVALESVRVGRHAFKSTFARPAMGTLLSVTTLSGSPDQADEALAQACEELDRLVALLTRFEDCSAVGILNREGQLRDVPPELARVLDASGRHHALSDGAFDVTVKPLLDLFSQEPHGAWSPPDERRIAEARARTGFRYVEFAPGAVRFSRPGMSVTLDGIAKGYIVDRMSDVLRAWGLHSHLINAGGDVRACGRKEDGSPWTVAVRNPGRGASFPDIVHIEDAAVATSGSYEIYFDRDRDFHHIVSSADGRSPVQNVSVSVVAPTAMAADALATAAFVMPSKDALRFIDRLPGCSCLLIDGDGVKRRSRRWRSAVPSYPERSGRW